MPGSETSAASANSAPPASAAPRRRSRFLLWGGGFVGLILVLMFLAWSAGPPLVRSWVAGKIGEAIGRKVEFGAVAINPLNLSLAVRDIAVYEADGTTRFVGASGLLVKVSLASVRRLAPVLDTLQLEAPFVRVIHEGEGKFNFSDILARLASQPADPKAEPARFSLNNITITSGRFEFDDRARGGAHVLSDLEVGVPFLSNLPYAAELFTEPVIRAKVDGAPLVLQGKTLPFAPSHQTSLSIDLDGLDLKTWAGFIPALVKAKLVAGKLDTKLSIGFEQKGDVQQVLLDGKAALRELAVQEAGGAPLLNLARLEVGFDKTEPLAREIRIAAITAEAPETWVRRDKTGRVNWQDVVASPAPAAAAASAAPAAARVIAVGKIGIAKGKLTFEDAGFADAKGAPVRVAVRELELDVQQFSTGAGEAPVKLAMLVNDAAKVGAEARLGLADGAAQGTLAIDGFKPRALQPFYAAALRADLSDTALDARLNFRTSWKDAFQFALTESSARLRDLRLALPDAKEALASARIIEAEGINLDLAQRRFALTRALATGLKADLARNADGSLNVLALLAPSDPKATAMPAAPTKPAVPNAKALAGSAAKAPDTPWRVALKSVQLAQSDLAFTDHGVAAVNRGQPARLAWSQVNVRVDEVALPLENGKAWPVSVAWAEAPTGNVKVSGTLTPQPLAANLELDVGVIDVVRLQPYFGQFSNAALTSAFLTVKGRASFALPEGSAPRAGFEGSIGVANARAVDRINGEDFARWRGLDLPAVEVRYNLGPTPVEVNLGAVTLSDYFARIILNADGRLNLSDIVAKPDAQRPTSLTQATPVAPTGSTQGGGTTVAPLPAPAAPVAAGPAPVIRVGQVRLQRGNINFSDFFIKPNYTTNLTGVSGSISRVASDNPAPADVSIEGRVDDDAPVRLVGQVNPLSSVLFLDLAAQARGIELTRLTPYAAKYAGYPITRGKLTVDLKYRIEQGKLEATNHLFLDQLTFGDKVESPDATKLPVMLAVALLKNSRGEIDVNLPISGSLSDPDFSIGGIVLRIIGNLIVKAVTAPFSLLASIFGGSDSIELSYLEFAPGSAEIGPAQVKALDTLGKALNDRTGLKLEITGRVDPVADIEGVRQAYVLRQVRAQKRRALIAQGQTTTREDVEVTPEEYPKYLELAYKAEAVRRPSAPAAVAAAARPAAAPGATGASAAASSAGAPATTGTAAAPAAAPHAPTVAEMEKALHDNAPIDENTLKGLADRRALRVKRYLEDEAKIPGERMFLIAPKLTAEGVQKGSPSRVDFAVQS